MSVARNSPNKKIKNDFCKICFTKNIPVHCIMKTHLQAVYENLTEVSLDSKDLQSLLVCHKCCGHLQHCYQLRRSCIQNEELFSQLYHCCVKLERLKSSHLQSPPETPFPSTMLEVLLEEQDRDGSDEEQLVFECEVKIQEYDKDDPETTTLATRERKTEDNHSSYTESDKIIKEINSLNKPIDFNCIKNNDKHNLYSIDSCMAIKSGHLTWNRNRCFQCIICSKCFAQKQKLQNHLRVHSGERPFQCKVCKKCFSQCSTLALHNRTHTKEKPFDCCICKKSFSTKSSRDKHVNVIHAGYKPFSCSYCLKTFSLRAKLELHLSVHTGFKRFNCTLCDRSFNRRDRFDIHLRTHRVGKAMILGDAPEIVGI